MQSYLTTATSVYSTKYHIVWCPKYRRAVLAGHIEGRLRELVEDEIEYLNGRVIEMEVMPDHVHLLAEIPPQIAVCEAMRRIKGQTSRVLRSEYPSLQRLPSLWTRSYFVSSVGGAPLEVVRRYVEIQKVVT